MNPSKTTIGLVSAVAVLLLVSVGSTSAMDFDLETDRDEKGQPLVSEDVKIALPTHYREKGIEQLFSNFSIGLADVGLDQLSEETIRSQTLGGGLSMAIAYALSGTWPNNPNLTLKWNRMRFHIDSYNRSAVLDIAAVKTLTENGVETDIKYRWVIAIRPGGLRTGHIMAGDLTYKIYARGQDVEIISFEIDDQPVKYFFPDGSINQLAKVYSPSNDDCIEIDLKVAVDGDGVITSPTPEMLNFCAGSCSGYLLAATR